MASSDDEGETLPDSISDYCFYNGQEEPLSFSKLYVKWNENESSTANVAPIFLGGKVDKGLRKFYQQVKAWKYDFTKDIPEILVLSKDNHWIKLQKPRKSYENLIRTILITVSCLCFCKRKPEASGKSLWDHLSKVFSLYDIRPSENDLVDQMKFIREAVKRDGTLAKSKFLAAFLENPRKMKSPDEDDVTATKPSFIVDDVNGEPLDDDFIRKQIEDSDSDEEDDHFDSVCAICDNGGKLICCEGKCFRSFHATGDSEEAQDSQCESLDLTPEESEGTYKCENCRYNLHQCFVCGELGSSDKSKNAEVFRCSSATCGHFYHPRCVANLLQKNDKTEQQSLKEKIAAGDPFICPAHKCAVCKQTENEKIEDFQFAICRRCPTSYHRKCLPSDIMFDDCDEVRAWDGLLNKSRALIYCIKHEIDEELATPERTLKFKNILHKKTKQPSELLKKKKKFPIKETVSDSEQSFKKRSIINSTVSVGKRFINPEISSKKRLAAVSSGSEPLKRKKLADNSKNSLKRNLSLKDNQPSLGSRLFDYYTATESNNVETDDTSVADDKQIIEDKSQQMEILPPLDDDSKQRILALMKDASSSVTLDDIKKYHKGKVPSTHAQSSRVDKSIILSRVEGSVEAVHLALKKLEEGCSVEDAMAVCEPSVIDQIWRWKEKLRVYLAPFLHGMRYTSFGRHFTKVEKLEKIVDKLQWYIEDGDTVVDFCCGANDFSCLVKKRLDEMGKKKCSYKNYDITPPKNDFNFEKRDWMTVSPKELPNGSRLIMGLNPPFGKNAALANQFIDSALRFKPKLIVLIVPPETERLDNDKKKVRYDLVWEDVELLAGKSFYLPGSVDVNDKQMEQWNNTPPPLYLWSRPDMTSRHKSIAKKHGHIPKPQLPPQSVEIGPESGLTVEKNKVEKDVPAPVGEPTTDEAKKPNIKGKKKLTPKKGNSAAKTKTKLISRVPSREVEVQNHEKTCEPVCEDLAMKDDQKNDKIRAQDPAQKHDKTREPVREVEAQKNDKTRGPFREDQAQKHDKTLGPAREDQAQKHDKTRGPAREIEAPEHDITRGPDREDNKTVNPENKRSPGPTETRDSDFSFVDDIGKELFDQNLETRYNSTIDESTFSLYNPNTDDPYVSSAYRRLDGPNLTTSTYSMRPDPIPAPVPGPYSGYDRVNRGSYYDDMGSRVSSNSSYHHEPGLTRYGSVDTTPYNQTSTSAMNRYAPRLDELNHTMTNNLGRAEIDHTRVSHMGRSEPPRGMGGYGPPLHGPGFSGGFAPGLNNPYLQQHNSSGGWLNE